jgi:hypothetical protein
MGAGCAGRFMSGSARGCVQTTRKRPAVRKMEVDPPEPSFIDLTLNNAMVGAKKEEGLIAGCSPAISLATF